MLTMLLLCNLAQLLYDVFVVCLALFNALDRPRGPRHKIVTNLHRDGAIWFFCELCQSFFVPPYSSH